MIAVDEAHPFEWVTSDFDSHAVYDKSMGYVIATVRNRDDGRLWVQMATQCDSGFVANDLRDAAQSAGSLDAEMMEKGWG